MPNDAAVNLRDGGRALVIGVGRSGMATAAVLRDRGMRVAAYDDKTSEQLAALRADLARMHVDLVERDDLAEAAAAAGIAILSPGIPFTNPAVLAVRRAGVPIISEIEAAYRLSKAPIIAVTGSKGKSTTTALIGHLLRGAGMRARVGGNIGNPLIAETAAASADEWIVAEVSSFQLEGTNEFRPRISVLLNLTPDHLDRYRSMDEYREAKFRIFSNQGPGDTLIANAADPLLQVLHGGIGPTVPCRILWFASEQRDDVAMSLQDGAIVWRRASTGRVNSTATSDVAIIEIAKLPLIGMHNVANAMAASLAALTAGAPVEAVQRGLLTFTPMPHRLQIVARSRGVTWVDDSKASNPDAVQNALRSFGAPIVLIAGGRSKHTDFHEMAKAIAARAKFVVLIGESAREIGALIGSNRIAFADSMEQAVATASQNAVQGDVVLLSPGCASFDMFESAEQRGEAFASAVQRQTAASGAAS